MSSPFGEPALEYVSLEVFPEILGKIDIHPYARELFKKKAKVAVFKIRGLKAEHFHYLKEEAIAVGADVAVPYFPEDRAFSNSEYDIFALLVSDLKRLEELSDRLAKQPVSSLRKIGHQIKEFLLKNSLKHGLVHLPHGKEIDLSSTSVMGVLNVTPDSFYDGGRYCELTSALRHAEEMVNSGAKIIDVGGVSTRPGSEPVSEDEELERVIPVVRELSKLLSGTEVVISIDTYRSKVASMAIEEGASIVNDISGGTFDENIRSVVARSGALVVVQHIKGTPADMQKNPEYKDLMFEIKSGLLLRARKFVESDVPPEKIVLDPGIGFGKRWEHNYEILKRIDELRLLGFPLLVGHSRKSFLGALTGEPPQNRLIESLSVAFYLALKDISIIRTHDVLETSRVIKVAQAIKMGSSSYRLFVDS